jgi:alpha-ketoglutarate-dependent taurine dioxygenase
MDSLKYKKINDFILHITDFELHQVDELKAFSRIYPLIIVKNFQHSEDSALLNFARQLSTKTGEIQNQVLHWEFGPIMRMGYQMNAKNYLFSQERVPFHWDGAFYQEPQWLLFFCECSGGVGGETLFTNTESIWLEATPERKKIFASIRLTYETEKKAHYGGKITVNMMQTHPLKKTTILRFAESVETTLNPVSLKIESREFLDTDSFVKKMQQDIYSTTHCYQHLWESGDLVLADNYSLIHGRNELGENLQRKFKRIQIL